MADSLNSCIQLFTMEGQCISCVGKQEEGPLELDCQVGITANKTTCQVFVADYNNY